MKNINLKQLETFVWVADLGNFRQAATRLSTTQPNISSRISALESSVGTRLLDRGASPIRLTAKGAELLMHARRVLRSMEEFIDAVDDTSLFTGVLRLGVTEMVVGAWLREFLRLFKEQYPEVMIELNVDLSVNLETEMQERSIDIAFQSGPFKHRLSVNRPLGSYPLVWVAAPDVAKQLPSKPTADDMLTQPIITHARSTHTYAELQDHFSKQSDTRPRLNPCSNLASSVQMTVDGFGISPMLLPLVRAQLATKRLVQIPYRWTPESLDFFARYDEKRASIIIADAAEIAERVSIDYLTTL